MITFMHYRKHNRMGQILAKGGLTLAIQQDGNNLSVAMAECGRKDNFDRKMGRLIASGRLKAGISLALTLPDATNVKSFVHAQQFVQDKVQKLLAGGK